MSRREQAPASRRSPLAPTGRAGRTVAAAWRRALLALGVTTGLVLSGAAVGATAASADPVGGVISGRMASALAQTPLPGDVVVRAAESGSIVTAVTTDSQGRYSVPVAAGTYTVQFRPSFVQDAEAPYGYPPAFYLDAVHASGAVPVTVADGATVQADGRLKAAGALMGNVTGATGRFALALVEAGAEPPADPFDGEHFAVEAQDDGGYVLPGAAGSYQLAFYRYADGWGFAGFARSGASFVVESGQPEIVDVYAGPTGSIDVAVRDSTGAAIADVPVTLRSPDGVVRIQSETDEAGAVAFDGLEPDDWQLSVLPDDDRFAPLWVRGIAVDAGETVTVPVALGDPLPAGATATPSLRTADGVLLLDKGPLLFTVPGADDLVGVDYIVSDFQVGVEALTGALERGEDGTWSATVDVTPLEGKVTIGLVLHRSEGWTEQTVAPAAEPRVVDVAELTDASRGAITTPATATAGSETTVSGLTAGEWYYTWWFSSPTAGGWVQADASGTATVVVPADLGAGPHAVALLDRIAQFVGWAPLTVVAANGGGGGSGAGGGAAGSGASGAGAGGQLAATGVGATGGIPPLGAGAGAFVLLLAGAALAARGTLRRRHSRAM
ncbi:carboxypeptidase regulatory-like domain-containing protein [Cnuibacter physcomitrellae]|uniref:MSCRAMM family protein n=1 Tax=Cnuibacter physcomitrellae TaxID=1619308 RepID=UPI002175EA9B|nr:carboxypeptidase regulatory-like domain-containing protein [Cnuibacter physcomitrellae]MCS5497969.1 carboxypeptidase regulatory-like domain-containing protein [Cnuibacter physcomitrellae]